MTFLSYLIFSLVFVVTYSNCNGKIVFEIGQRPVRSEVLDGMIVNVTTGLCGEVFVSRTLQAPYNLKIDYIKVERLDDHPVNGSASLLTGGYMNSVTLSFNAGISPEPVTLIFKATLEHGTAYCPPYCSDEIPSK